MFDTDNEFLSHSTTSSDNESPRWFFYRHLGKRLFDLTFVVLISPLLFPLIALIGLVVRLDGGTVFYGHKRVGKNGKAFTCWKLRTMVVDSEDRLRAYLEANTQAREYWQANFKLLNDPRVTKLGKLLRKTSLDELPQFWNVLVGDMSVVGPRPVTNEEIMLYGKSALLLQKIRPGITGLWQVCGRNDVDYIQRVNFDLRYINELDFAGDVRIILLTVGVMFKRTGN